MDLVIAAQVLFVIAILLLLHHGWHHLHDDPRTSRAQQESCPQVCYFQLSDVGNFRTCNHEMWILLCIFLALTCLVLSRLEVEST
jgi:hypothetical protein